MVKRVVYILMLLGAIGLCYLGCKDWRQSHAMLSGDVYAGAPDASGSAPPDPVAPRQTSTPASERQTADPSSKGSIPPSAALSWPETRTPEPANGMVHSGSGRFQIFRQGNITYRIDTDNGQACVLFATNQEWRKPLVYRHGCRNSAAQ